MYMGRIAGTFLGQETRARLVYVNVVRRITVNLFDEK
jgi:hypothetical protein